MVLAFLSLGVDARCNWPLDFDRVITCVLGYTGVGEIEDLFGGNTQMALESSLTILLCAIKI
jgi:hypothetical protein